MMDEDRLLLGIALDQALSTFDERDRKILTLYFQLDHPADYEDAWPPTYASVGRYVGERLGQAPITEGSVRYRVELALLRLKDLI
jgi:hypothetical protein